MHSWNLSSLSMDLSIWAAFTRRVSFELCLYISPKEIIISVQIRRQKCVENVSKPRNDVITVTSFVGRRSHASENIHVA